jgi:hypothetical protein
LLDEANAKKDWMFKKHAQRANAISLMMPDKD